MTSHDIPTFLAFTSWLMRLSGGPGSMPEFTDRLPSIRQAWVFGGHHE